VRRIPPSPAFANNAPPDDSRAARARSWTSRAVRCVTSACLTSPLASERVHRVGDERKVDSRRRCDDACRPACVSPGRPPAEPYTRPRDAQAPPRSGRGSHALLTLWIRQLGHTPRLSCAFPKNYVLKYSVSRCRP